MNKLQKSLLKDVSRSFYLSFLLVPKAVRSPLALGYFLCRAADSIADAVTVPTDERRRLLTQFKELFATFPVSQEKLREFLRELDQAKLSMRPNEQKIFTHFEICGPWFEAQSRSQQALIQSVVSSVIKGMEMDLDMFGEADGKLRALKTEKDLETYIHWIGGEPGRFWTGISLALLPELIRQKPDQLLHDGIVFGTGLQMVNILRDFPADLKNGRCYVPQEMLDRHDITLEDLQAQTKEENFLTIYNDLIDQTQFRLERGLSYIAQLPKSAIGMRAAVWWPMIIGAMTLKRLRETSSIMKAPRVKVTRSAIYKVMLTTFWMLPFDGLLKKRFEKET